MLTYTVARTCKNFYNARQADFWLFSNFPNSFYTRIMQTSSTFVSLRRSARQLALAATMGAAAISAQAQAPAQQQAAPSIDSFVSTAASYLTAISQGKAADVWQNSSPEMQKSETKKNFAKNIEAKYTEAGQITAREWIAVNRIVLAAPVKADKVTTPAGQYINVTFVASTNKNRNIAERVTFYLDKDGSWRPIGFVQQ